VRAGDVRSRLAGLREAGAGLRRRPLREVVDALARVLDGWRDPRSHWRRELEARLPDVAGFSAPAVREGLARGLASWSGESLRKLVRDELGAPALEAAGDEGPEGFATTALLLAGSIPMPTLLAMLAPLVLRSPLLAKCASRDPLTPELVARSIAETDAELGHCVAVLDFPGSDGECVGALLEADCVVAVGSDETIAAVARRVQAPRRLVAHGHRLSVAALGAALTAGDALEDAARRAALDVALWDQLGCLSPQALFVVGGDAGAPDRVAEALARALAEAERRWPRGRIEPAAAAAIARERSEAEMRAAAGRPVALHRGPGTSWTVVREEDARLRPAPLHRFVRVQPVAGPDALLSALRPLARHLAAVALDGFGAEQAPLAAELAALGASRTCPLGCLQSPPLDWRREGRGVLLPLLRHGPRAAAR
jgi:hypothetical protein